MSEGSGKTKIVSGSWIMERWIATDAVTNFEKNISGELQQTGPGIKRRIQCVQTDALSRPDAKRMRLLMSEEVTKTN